jgi:WD40 repeat protein
MLLRIAAVLGLTLLAVPAAWGQEPQRTDQYGDPLPRGAVARLGTIRLRHANALFTFSADGKQLISCDPEGDLRVWEVATGKLVRSRQLWRLKQQDRYSWISREWDTYAFRAELSPDGATVASRREDAIYLYDTATGDLRWRLPIDSPDKNESLRFSFSPDGKMLTVSRQPEGKTGMTLQTWVVATGKPGQIFKVPIGDLHPTAFSADGKCLAGVHDYKEIHIWDAPTGKVTDRILNLHANSPLAFSPDGKTLAAGLSGGLRVLLWDRTTRREKKVLELEDGPEKEGYVRTLFFSRDGRLLAGVHDTALAGTEASRCLVIWDLTGASKPKRLPERNVDWLAFAPDGKTQACSSHDCEIRLWDLTTGRQLHSRPGHAFPVRSLAASSDGRVLASGNEWELRVWDVAIGKQLHLFEHGGMKVHITTDGARVASITQLSGSHQDSIRVYDTVSGKEVRQVLTTRTPSATDFSQIEALGLSPDAKRVTAVVDDNPGESTQVYLWSIDTGRLLGKRSYPKGDDFPWAWVPASIAADGERLSLFRDGKFIIEAASTGQPLRTLPKSVHQVVFSPDGRVMAATNWLPKKGPTRDLEWKGLSLIETATGKEVLSWQTELTHLLAFTIDGRGLVSVDTKTLHVWDVGTGKLLHTMAWPTRFVERQYDDEPSVRSLAMLPGGRVATGMNDGNILIWDLAMKAWPSNGLARDLTSGELKKLWADLAGEAATAHRALHTLAASPAASLPFLNAHFLPAAEAGAKRVGKILADLDSDAFQTREAASRELIQLREWMEPTLRRMRENNPTPEIRRRLDAILSASNPFPLISAETLRMLRGVAILEYIGTPEAQRMLRKLAGAPTSPPTLAAQAALRRLSDRKDSSKKRSEP